MNKEIQWTPRVLPRGVYCSPRCGGNCKKTDYDKAVKAADALASRMGPGWEPVIWENLGWFYRVEKDVFEITSPHANDEYTAWIQTSPQFIASAKTPEDALGFAIQDARTHVRRIENALADGAQP